MDPSLVIDFDSFLPRPLPVDTDRLWADLPLDPVGLANGLLEPYLIRHDHWTDKLRVVGLDAGILVDYRTLPGLDRLVDRIYGPAGWTRPEIYIVSDIGRKGINEWTANAAVGPAGRSVMLLGSRLVEELNVTELAFVIGHEAAHLVHYTDLWRQQMALSHMIRHFVENERLAELQRLDANQDWLALYRTIMANARTVEIRCDRLGVALCGHPEAAARALLSVVLRGVNFVRHINLDAYLAVQVPQLATAPEAGPFTVNSDHPFVPYRIQALFEFARSGKLNAFVQQFGKDKCYA